MKRQSEGSNAGCGATAELAQKSRLEMHYVAVLDNRRRLAILKDLVNARSH